jgi:TolA-binding protein
VAGWQAALASGAPSSSDGSSDHINSRRAAAVSVEPPPFSSGIALYLAGDLVRAERAFRAALASPLEPAQQRDSAYNLGVVLTELGRLSDAEAAYRDHALRLDPTHEGSLLNWAALRSHAGDAAAAAALLARCLAEHPGSAEALQLQARLREGPFAASPEKR